MALTSPPTFEVAGRMGLGVLCFSLTAPGQSAKSVEVYRNTIRNAEPVGASVNNQVAAFTVSLCLQDDYEARRVGGFSAAAYAEGARQLYSQWSKSPDNWQAWFGREYLSEAQFDDEQVNKLINDGVVCIGDPERCIKVLKKWEEIGIDQIMCLMQGGRIPHDKIMESIRMFGEHVIPYFKKRDGTLQAGNASQ